jgi:hypothetical protein
MLAKAVRIPDVRAHRGPCNIVMCINDYPYTTLAVIFSNILLTEIKIVLCCTRNDSVTSSGSYNFINKRYDSDDMTHTIQHRRLRFPSTGKSQKQIVNSQ